MLLIWASSWRAQISRLVAAMPCYRDHVTDALYAEPSSLPTMMAAQIMQSVLAFHSRALILETELLKLDHEPSGNAVTAWRVGSSLFPQLSAPKSHNRNR